MTKYCKDMCIVCFAPKRYDSQWLYSPAEDNSLEINMSEVGLIYQDLIQVSLSCKESGPQYVCNYCKTQLNTFHKFKVRALDAFRKVSEENYGMPADQIIPTENLVKVEEITVFDVSTKQTEKFEIQYLDDDEEEDAAEIIEIDESKTFMDGASVVPVNGTSTSSSSKSNTSCTQIICQLCTKMFESNEAFNLHWKEHEEIPQYSCNKCPQKFHSRENYLRHINIHQGQKILNCGVCGKNFHRLCHLQFHMKTHTDERPYECGICHKRFRSNSHLKYHLYSHGEKQFQCDICLQMYSTPRTLSEHLKFVHKRELPYSCEICNKHFMRRHKLERHRMLHYRSNSRLLNVTPAAN